MALASGTRPGAYEVTALKVLLAPTTADPDRLRRFELEARATAALNHQNIVAVFDVGTEHGVSFVVSELLEGETLRDRLRGFLSPRRPRYCKIILER